MQANLASVANKEILLHFSGSSQLKKRMLRWESECLWLGGMRQIITAKSQTMDSAPSLADAEIVSLLRITMYYCHQHFWNKSRLSFLKRFWCPVLRNFEHFVTIFTYFGRTDLAPVPSICEYSPKTSLVKTPRAFIVISGIFFGHVRPTCRPNKNAQEKVTHLTSMRLTINADLILI